MTKILTLQAQSAASVKVTTKLNDQQLAAIQQLEGIHVINSGAGTGKSATLVARLQRLHEIYPTATVLMLAFSKAAVQELQQRVGAMHGVTISTFHSLAYHILKSSGWNFSVETSTENQTSAIESLIGRTKTTVEEVIRSLHGVSSASRSTLRVRRQFLSMLKEMHTVTFDTMIIFATGALQKHAGLRNYWQSRYDFVQVDEGQDLNPAQVELLQIVTAETKNLCLSGDPRQQIYGFRGAFGAMEKLSKTAQIHSLTKNYRFNARQLESARANLDRIERLSSELHASDMYDLLKIFELRERLTVAKVLIENLRARRETRRHGFAKHSDYPNRNPKFDCFVNSRTRDGKIEIIFRELGGV